MPLVITEPMRAKIRKALLAGGHCNGDHATCLCCAKDAESRCAEIVGAEYAAALQGWFYGALGCGFHHQDIRRRELGLESTGPGRERTYLRHIGEIDRLYTDAEIAADLYVDN
jgi:hypothetical protein